jgi:hypothetical protein
MRNPAAHIYKSEVSTGMGLFIFYVASADQTDARTDLHTAVLSEFGSRNYRIRETTKTNRNAIKSAWPAKNCVSYSSGEPVTWAWLKKAEKQAK